MKKPLIYMLKVREHEKNNLPVWIALFPICLLKFSLSTGSIRVKFEKTHRKIAASIRVDYFLRVPLIQLQNNLEDLVEYSCKDGILISVLQLPNIIKILKYL